MIMVRQLRASVAQFAPFYLLTAVALVQAQQPTGTNLVHPASDNVDRQPGITVASDAGYLAQSQQQPRANQPQAGQPSQTNRPPQLNPGPLALAPSSTAYSTQRPSQV